MHKIIITDIVIASHWLWCTNYNRWKKIYTALIMIFYDLTFANIIILSSICSKLYFWLICIHFFSFFFSTGHTLQCSVYHNELNFLDFLTISYFFLEHVHVFISWRIYFMNMLYTMTLWHSLSIKLEFQSSFIQSSTNLYIMLEDISLPDKCLVSKLQSYDLRIVLQYQHFQLEKIKDCGS